MKQYERLPSYLMPYEDRVTDEAWSIATTRKDCEANGRVWSPKTINVLRFRMADLVSDKKPELVLDIPEDGDYVHARQRVDARIQESQAKYTRIQRAKLVYVPVHEDPQWVNPWVVSLNAAWNGMRDPLSVGEYFALSGIPSEELKTIFRFDPSNPSEAFHYFRDFYGFATNGKQRLVDLIQKPTAFVNIRNTRHNWWSWDLRSKQILTPSGEGSRV